MTQPARPTHWWQAVDRRTFNKGAVAFTALLSMSGCKSEEEQVDDSLKLQQQQGWNVGAKESRLFFTSTTEKDASGSTEWRAYTDPTRLIAAWQPRTEAWQKFYMPTLMQALKDESLRTQMRLIVNHGMREAFARGETMRRDLLSQVDKGAETFFIVDLPGPEAVAFGAAMAGWADVIPSFDNWPHPHGVVRSHDTLAALLYYAAFVEEQKKQLPESAPGLLLLDSQRLAPYTDADDKFDNRYIATVPSAAALQQRGVKNIMYVVPTREQKEESDDLNDDFVAYKDAKLKVVLFPLSDFQKVASRSARRSPMAPPAPLRKRAITMAAGSSRISVFCSCTRFWHLGPCSITRPQWGIPIHRATPHLGAAVAGAVPPWGMCARPAHRHRATRHSRARRSLVATELAARQEWGVPNRQALAARHSGPAGVRSPVSDAQAHWAVAAQDRVKAASKGK